jgi:hypothetical protein
LLWEDTTLTIPVFAFGSPACRRLVRFLGLALALTGASTVVRAENGIGGWSALADWPLIPIHTMLLPNGTVMTYGSNADGQQTGRFIYDVWDPRQGLGGGHLTLPNTTQTDLFCSAQIIVPTDNRVFLAGGDMWNGTRTTNASNNDTLIFDPTTNTLIPSADMALARWYATLTTLPNGEIYIQGGRQTVSQGGAVGVDLAEVRTKTGALRALNGMSTADLPWWYPRNWVAPDGRIFGYSYRKMYYVDPTGAGTLTRLSSLPSTGPEGVTSSAVMYAPGKILRTGGGAYAAVGPQAGRTAAIVIDINGAKPKVTNTAPLPVPLQWHNATVVPDGRVVVTGGSAKADQLVDVNDRAYIWSPTTGTWTAGAQTNSGKARLYHSMAMLLPDASILVGGGGAGGNMPQNNTNAEIYYPPYLYNASGQFAPRPRITGGATALKYKGTQNIKVDNAAAIARVTLIKTGSVTHSFNMEQRFLELSFTVDDNVLKVKAPANANLAPPGRYMLFVINAQGVPSVARLVSIAPPA